MNDRKMTRRQALVAGATGVLAGGVTGCGGSVAPTARVVARVVIRVAWPSIQRVIAAVVRRTDLIVKAIVATVERTLNAKLTSEQASSLKSGGQLYLRTEDGVEHEIPYTIES